MRARQAAGIVCTLALVIGVVGFAAHNLGNRYFWTDESATFLTALGWPAPGQSIGRLADAWSITTTAFLDPGLFHLLVRYWSEIAGTGIETLRFLPFAFFLVYLVCLFFVFKLVGAPWFLAIGGVSIMMLENITPYYAVELRPYSAGLAASVALPLLALLFIRSTTVPRLALLLVGIALIGSMQYNTLPITLAVVVMLGIAILQTKVTRERLLLAIGAAVALIWLPAFFLITRGNPLQRGGGEALDYIPNLVLGDMEAAKALQVIATNMLSPTGLPRTVFLVLIPLLWWAGRLRSPADSSDASGRVINLIWVFVAVSTVATFAFALLGFLPWVLGTRWSIADIGLIALSLAGLVGVLMRTAWASRRTGTALLIAGSVAASLLGGYRLWTYERIGDMDYLSAFAPILVSGEPGGAVVDAWLYSDVRYWLEYSGDYSEWTEAWIAQGVSSTEGSGQATAADVESFLQSDEHVLLFRSARALTDTGVQLPPNVAVLTVPATELGDVLPADAPVLLVKEQVAQP